MATTDVAKPLTKDTPRPHRISVAAAAGCSVATLEAFIAGHRPGQRRSRSAYDWLVARGYLQPTGVNAPGLASVGAVAP